MPKKLKVKLCKHCQGPLIKQRNAYICRHCRIKFIKIPVYKRPTPERIGLFKRMMQEFSNRFSKSK